MRSAFIKGAATAVAVNAALWIVAAMIGLVPALGESTFFGGVLFASFGATAAAAIVASRFTAAGARKRCPKSPRYQYSLPHICITVLVTTGIAALQ